MIKNNVSKVEITTKNIKYYKNKGYICEVGVIINTSVTIIPSPRCKYNVKHVTHSNIIK